MSGSDEEISNAGSFRHDCKGGDGDGDDDSDGGDHAGTEGEKKKHSCIGKAKQVVMNRFPKAKKKLRNSWNKRAFLSSLSMNASGSTSGQTIHGHGGWSRGCYFCFTRPRVVESFHGSPNSDLNDPNFSKLIEKNDFFSRECNPHVD